MPQATPKRAGRQARPGSRFLGEVLAANVRGYRLLRRMSQAQLAREMSDLGHEWTESIVGFVERGDRNVTVDEWIALALTLGLGRPGALLDPTGAGPNDPTASDLDLVKVVVERQQARQWLAGRENLGIVPSKSKPGEWSILTARFTAVVDEDRQYPPDEEPQP